MSMSFSGAQVFGNGVTVKSISLPTAGSFGFTGDTVTGTPSAQTAARMNARSAIMQLADANQIVTASQGAMGFAFNASTVLSPILQGTGSSAITTAFTGLNTGLSNQLKAVAKVIEQSAAIGHQREIFFVSIGGFDTHTGEVAGHNSLYPQVSKAINAFYQATVGMGVANNVTTFTLSDFGTDDEAQRRWNRSRLGQPSFRRRRRRCREQDLWHLPEPDGGRTGRLG